MSKSKRDETTRRDRAAAARTAAENEEKRRAFLVKVVGAVVVAVVIVGILAVAMIAKQNVPERGAVSADPSAAQPVGTLDGGDPLAYGVPYGKKTAGAPTLAIWEDFQCPACKAVEDANGGAIEALAESGRVNLVWRPTTFLDANLRNDASLRAAAAWGCAIDAGVTRRFHDVVYQNQPEKEGTGYTDDQLLAFGGTAGLTGDKLATYTQCVNDGTYKGWASNSTSVFVESQVPGTPYATLDGKVLDNAVLANPEKLQAAVDAAAKARTAMTTSR